MKARIENGNIKIYKSLPKEFTLSDGTVSLTFDKSSAEILEYEGFYDVVKPSYNPLTQEKGGLAFDKSKNAFTYPVTDIDFSVEIDIIDEDGELTGETEKRYKIADIKASKIAEIKSQANKRLLPTDWQIIRKLERDIDIDTEVAEERASVLAEASRLEAEVNAKKSYKTVLEYNVQFFPSDEIE